MTTAPTASASPETVNAVVIERAATGSPLAELPGQPLCKHYTGAALENLTGDYSCRCLAGVPYERWTPSMNRWPCRRRHILGVEQHECEHKDYGDTLTDSVDNQITEMALRAIQ